MNDREQLLAIKAESQRMAGHSAPEPPNIEEIKQTLIEKARYTRFYFDVLVSLGFDNSEALAIAAHARF